LAGVVRQRFEIVLEQEISLQSHLRVRFGRSDSNGESRRELDQDSFGSFHVIPFGTQPDRSGPF
jgi:hypothetical protein